MDLFNLEKIKQRHDNNLPVVVVFTVTTKDVKKSDRLFREFSRGQTRNNWLNLQQQRFRLDSRENFLTKTVTKHYNRLPRWVVELPFVEILKQISVRGGLPTHCLPFSVQVMELGGQLRLLFHDLWYVRSWTMIYEPFS